MIKIFTLYHREPREPLQNEIFVPFITGSASEKFLNDSTSFVPEISDCCELAYFHVWRHLYDLGFRDDDHIGFQQYRRVFFFDGISPQREFQQTMQSFYTLDPENFAGYCRDLQNAGAREAEAITKTIAPYDAVTIKPWPVDSIAKHFQSSHGDEATTRLREVMADRQMNIDASRAFHPCCLFILRVDVFKRYMREWLRFIGDFRMPCAGEPGHTERIYGYALERFWSMWYEANRAAMTTNEIPFVYCHHGKIV